MSQYVLNTSLGFAWGMQEKSNWSSLVIPTVSGRGTVQIPLSAYPLRSYTLSFPYLSGGPMVIGSPMSQLMGFFNSVSGDGDNFLCQIPWDCSTDQPVTITNSGFLYSSQLPPYSWVKGASGLNTSCTLGYDASSQYTGTQSLKITATAQDAGVTNTTIINVTAGTTYSLYGAMKSISADACNINLTFLNSSGSVTGQVNISTTSASWVYKTASAAAPSTSVTAVIQCFMSGASGGTGEFGAISAWIVNPIGIATGDGSTKKFAMTRTLGTAGFDLIQNFITSPNIYLNNVVQTSGYSIDGYGTLTFSSAPSLGVSIAWNGMFYRRLRFVNGTLPFTQVYSGLWKVEEMELMEVIS